MLFLECQTSESSTLHHFPERVFPEPELRYASSFLTGEGRALPREMMNAFEFGPFL